MIPHGLDIQLDFGLYDDIEEKRKEAKAQNSANVTKAMKIVKGKIKNMPQDISNSDTWTQENRIAMQFMKELIFHY